ncbi:ATP-binding protein [Actinoplanes sp. DH11]|uniref:ATP-binding protein n=1 Tax=Actinoplanes sp. DH11 TaxID=2857011 RepID=UPI001E3738BC|nr:ATP-binding protein [Actinoplanes sp. DH11]
MTVTDPDDRLMRATMTWLRALLVPPRRHSWLAGWRRAAARRARTAVEEALDGDPPPRFTELCRVFRLRPFERDVTLLCLAHAVSTEIARRCAAMPESAGDAPTFALALGLAMDPEYDGAPPARQATMTRVAAVPDWDALAPDRPLRARRLLELTQPPGRPLISSALRLDERIVNHVRGHSHLDARLATLMEAAPADPDGQLTASQRGWLDAALDRLQRLSAEQPRLLVQLPGGDAATKRLFAGWLAGAAGLALYRMRLEHAESALDVPTLAALWNREQHLQDVALLIEATDPGLLLTRLLDRLCGLVFLDVRDPLAYDDTTLVLDVARPTPDEQRALWRQVLGDGGDWPERLAGQFDLNAGELMEALAIAHDDSVPTARVGALVWDAYRARARPLLEGLAQRIVTGTTLAHVQLPEAERQLLEQVRDQAAHRVRVYDRYGFRARLGRGLGITALLTGESGTGKTLAAEALANELRLDLYRIDLAGVVSKYIGETEKNLRRVFDAAEQSAAVLLFDEADAIFGKRSEVQDSHDRYANIEVSYLLQRMEAYRGLAILTTNMKSALDPAFLRRLRFVIAFPFPGPAERLRIWQGVFPAAADGNAPPGVGALDMAALARPSLTGGQIRNVALNATFLAAARGGDVTMALLAEAARTELRKSGRPFVAADYTGWRAA